MSNVESSALQSHPAAASSLGVSAARGTSETGGIIGKAGLARKFLIHLISREVQLSEHAAKWLRTTGQRLADQQFVDLSADCGRLATQTWELREQLLALAHRLIARHNRGLSHGRINVMQLLEEPPSAGMQAFIELNRDIVDNAAPGVELAVMSAIEQLLVGVVPLAIDIGGFDDAANEDLVEVAEVYAARFARVEALRQLTAALVAVAPQCREALRDASDRAIDSYTPIIRESAELGYALAGAGNALAGAGEHHDDDRGSMC